MKYESRSDLVPRTRDFFIIHNSYFILFLCLLAPLASLRADDSSHAGALHAVATTDSTEVHPDSVFEVTLALENVSDTTQTIVIPECGWDRTWKSSDRRVTWDFWDCDNNAKITIQIPAHESYTFSTPLKMFVTPSSSKEARIVFRMGFKTAAFGKVLWSGPMTIDVIP